MSNSSLSISASISTASQVGEEGCVEEGCGGLSTFFGGLQHQRNPARHLTLLRQKLHVRTINRARMNVGIPNGFLDPNSHGFVEALVFVSTESNLALDSLKSVKDMY